MAINVKLKGDEDALRIALTQVADYLDAYEGEWWRNISKIYGELPASPRVGGPTFSEMAAACDEIVMAIREAVRNPSK
jgi:hypothetical protein